MDVDRAGDVFQAGAHLDGQREFAGQFGDMRAHGVNTQDDMIALARRDTDKPAIRARFHGQIPTGGRQWEFSGDDLFALGLGLVRGQADTDNFRLGETDRSDGDRIKDTLVASDQFGDHLALGRGLVCQQRLANNITDRPDIAHAGAALVINLDETAINQIKTHIFHTPAIQAGLAADRNEDLVGFNSPDLALGVLVFQNGHAVLLRHALGLAGEVHRDLVFLQPHGDRTGDFLVIERKNAVRRLDEGHLAAQLAESDTQFQTDIARTHDDQLLRLFGEVQRIGGPNDLVAKGQEGQLHLDRAGGQNDMLGRDLDLAFIGVDNAGLGVLELRPAGNVLNARSLDQLANTARQLGDDAVLPADQLAHVQLGCLGQGDAQRVAVGMFGHFLILGRRMDHRLGGNTAAIEAGAAQAVFVDNDRIQTQLARANSRRISTRTTTNDENLARTCLHGDAPWNKWLRNQRGFARHLASCDAKGKTCVRTRRSWT